MYNTLVSAPHLDYGEFLILLEPVPNMLKSEQLYNNMNMVASLITKNISTVNIDSIKNVLFDDLTMSSIITSLLLFIKGLETVKFEYHEGTSEQIITKILLTIFLYIIPKDLNFEWTKNDIMQIMEAVDRAADKQTVNDSFALIINWLSKTKCCISYEDADKLVAKKIVKTNDKIVMNLSKNE